MDQVKKLFNSYQEGEKLLWRKVNRECKLGKFSAESCVEIERRSEGKITRRELRPDLFFPSPEELELRKELAELKESK